MTRSPWFEAGTIEQPSGASDTWSIDVTDAGLTSPAVVSSEIFNVTDPDNISADLSGTLLGGDAAITTSTWTTPIVGPLVAANKYRLHVNLSDSGNSPVLVVYFWCPY